MAQWKLIDEKTGAEIALGSNVTTFRGEKAKLISLRPPHKPASSGHVTLKFSGSEFESEFYPGVIGAKYTGPWRD